MLKDKRKKWVNKAREGCVISKTGKWKNLARSKGKSMCIWIQNGIWSGIYKISQTVRITIQTWFHPKAWKSSAQDSKLEGDTFALDESEKETAQISYGSGKRSSFCNNQSGLKFWWFNSDWGLALVAHSGPAAHTSPSSSYTSSVIDNCDPNRLLGTWEMIH